MELVKEQTNKTMEHNSPKIDPHEYCELIFDKETKTIQWTKETFQQIVLEQLDIHRSLDTDFMLITKINSK